MIVKSDRQCWAGDLEPLDRLLGNGEPYPDQLRKTGRRAASCLTSDEGGRSSEAQPVKSATTSANKAFRNADLSAHCFQAASARRLDERTEFVQVVRPEQGQAALLRLFEIEYLEDASQRSGWHDLRSAELLDPVFGLDGCIVV